MCTGKILPTNLIIIVGSMKDAMLDLSNTIFCVPVIDKFSPVTYITINKIHWYSNVGQLSGIETVWKYVLKRAFTIYTVNL